MTGIEPVFLLLKQDLLHRAEQGGMILRLKLGGDGRGLGGAALSLSWQTAGIAALAAALLSWLSGRLGASGVRK